MIYAVLSNFDFVAKFTVTNMNKDFINSGPDGEAIVKKIPEFYEIISQTGRGGQSDFISLIQKK